MQLGSDPPAGTATIVYDGPDHNVVPVADNVTEIYSGGAALERHKGDKRIVEHLSWKSFSKDGTPIYLVTDDNDLAAEGGSRQRLSRRVLLIQEIIKETFGRAEKKTIIIWRHRLLCGSRSRATQLNSSPAPLQAKRTRFWIFCYPATATLHCSGGSVFFG